MTGDSGEIPGVGAWAAAETGTIGARGRKYGVQFSYPESDIRLSNGELRVIDPKRLPSISFPIEQKTSDDEGVWERVGDVGFDKLSNQLGSMSEGSREKGISVMFQTTETEKTLIISSIVKVRSARPEKPNLERNTDCVEAAKLMVTKVNEVLPGVVISPQSGVQSPKD
jgi:hypothetical protein